LNFSIQAPGFGRNFNHAGWQLRITYGNARPSPTTANISRINGGGCAKANPSAAPRNGAVQGVASTVASTPLKKAPAAPERDASAPAAFITPLPGLISKSPNKFNATSVTMTVR